MAKRHKVLHTNAHRWTAGDQPTADEIRDAGFDPDEWVKLGVVAQAENVPDGSAEPAAKGDAKQVVVNAAIGKGTPPSPQGPPGAAAIPSQSPPRVALTPVPGTDA